MNDQPKELSKSRISCKKWEAKNEEKMKQYWKDRYAKNKEKEMARIRKWRAENPEKHREGNRKYHQKTKHLKKEYVKKRFKTHPETKVRSVLSTRLCVLLKRAGTTKSCSVVKLFGCSPLSLRKHLEDQFLPGMNWDNHGREPDCWQIDHIRPCESFNLIYIKQQRECFHYTNLRPLWAPDNWRKNKYWDSTSYVSGNNSSS